ncbi:hypothetical protein [Tateyamaria sp. SN6-1]
MKRDYAQAETTGADWCETPYGAFHLGLPRLFSIAWLIDKADCGEWCGV